MPDRTQVRSLAWLLIALIMAAGAAAWLGGRAEVPREAAWMGGIFVLAAILWVTEALPLFATSLIVIGLQIVLLANPGDWPGLGFEDGAGPAYQEVVARAADPILMLFFGGFLLARAASNEGVDRAFSALMLRPFGTRPHQVMLGVMVATATFSMWMSNTATTAMMIALVGPMLAQIPEHDRFRRGLVLAVPFAANLGGIGTPIGSPPNAVAMAGMIEAGVSVSFLQWMLVGLPFALVLLLVAWALLWRFYRPETDRLRIETAAPTLDGRAWFVVVVFSLTVLLWITDRLHGLPSAVVALVPAIAFTATGILKRTDVDSMEWHVLILIGGGISLGAGMQMTGLDRAAVGWLPLEEGASLVVLCGVLAAVTLALSTFMSNTAAANLLLPVGISAAMALSADGARGAILQVAFSIAIPASAAMALPISTPPNAIAYSRGVFSTADMVRTGSLISIAALLLVIALLPTALRFVLGID